MMKKWFAFFLALCMALSLMACGGDETAKETTAAGKAEAPATFMAGFGKEIFTPEESVPMGGYGNSKERMSTGKLSELEARAVAVTDENGDSLIFLVGDLSWCPGGLGNSIRSSIENKLGVPADHVIMSGTHSHGTVDTDLVDMPVIQRFNVKYVEAMVKAAEKAMEDRSPAQAYAGVAETEGLNFVRRYFMDDGSLSGDNTPGTGTTLVSHETEADGQLQLVKFVREEGKDIVLTNFQCHPHLEGKTTNLSAQVVGTFRDAMEAELGVHCLYWQGASGNLNSNSYITGENRTTDRKEWGQLLCGYAKEVYNDLTAVKTGPVKVTQTCYKGKVNHEYDYLTNTASTVWATFEQTNDHKLAMTYAEGTPITSVYHANRIKGNAQLGETKDMDLYAWSCGDLAGVVVPYEMFDTNGMEIKSGSPFEMTFIISYAWPGYRGYIASEAAWKNGGYECDNSVYVRGAAEELVASYLGMLNELKGQ